jgi:hypothetical protein
MLFNFTLIPIEEIEPWSADDNLSLSWFGLTDGFYWIGVGESTLFEYSAHAQAADAPRFCNYQVVRLYEDLMKMLPHILEPIPHAIAQYLSGDGAAVWRLAYRNWCEQNSDVLDSDKFWDIVDATTTWSGERRLDNAYLSPSANIVIWSDEEYVFFEWDNTSDLINGQPAWSALHGRYQLSRSEFIKEIQSFHFRLIAQMEKRVEMMLSGVLSTKIKIDMKGLASEHAERGLTLEKAMSLSQQTDWQITEKYINEILQTNRDQPN